MESECVEEKVNNMKFDQIEKIQNKIIGTQGEHDARLKVLEDNRIETKMSLQALKESQSDQKILTLQLDSATNAKIDRQFDKLYLSQQKIEKENTEKFDKIIASGQRNEDKYDKLFTGQTSILKQIVDNQTINTSNKFELTKSKLTILLGVVTLFATIMPMIIGHFWK